MVNCPGGELTPSVPNRRPEGRVCLSTSLQHLFQCNVVVFAVLRTALRRSPLHLPGLVRGRHPATWRTKRVLRCRKLVPSHGYGDDQGVPSSLKRIGLIGASRASVQTSLGYLLGRQIQPVQFGLHLPTRRNKRARRNVQSEFIDPGQCVHRLVSGRTL